MLAGLEATVALLSMRCSLSERGNVCPAPHRSSLGARMLKLVFAKYVRGLGWHIRLGPRVSVQQPHGAGAAASAQASGQHGAALAPAQLLEATQVFLHSLLDVVEAQCEVWRGRGNGQPTPLAGVGRTRCRASCIVCARVRLQLATEPEASASLPGGGLLQACRSSFAHGPLLLTRYVVEDAPWADLAASSPAAPRTARALVARALALLQRTAGLCVPPLTAPTAGVGAEDADEAEFADGGALAEEAEGEGGGGPDAQMVLTGCWLTAKEVALLAGALVHALPLEEEAPGGGAAAAAGAAEGGVGGAWLLGVGQVHEVGRLLVSTVMLEVRHTGVLDKAAAALTLVVDKLLRCGSPWLVTLWKEEVRAFWQWASEPAAQGRRCVRRGAERCRERRALCCASVRAGAPAPRSTSSPRSSCSCA